MKIIFIANHDQPNTNDEEGSVTYALESLGHHVTRLQENRGHLAHKLESDLVLFFKWRDAHTLKQIKVPKVTWWFDLIDHPDPSLSSRCQTRKDWMKEIIPLVDLAFLTDGDWVQRDRSRNLVHLTQGADSRIAGPGTSDPNEHLPPLLFTGIRRGGLQRSSFVDEMQTEYRSSFNHVERGVHGVELANLIAGSRIVVAPDGPVTSRYWSNRVYLSLGFSAFLLHPYCELLAHQYEDRKEIVYYHSRDELHQLIRYYFKHPDERQQIAVAGLERTLTQHTYRHRCKQLISIVQERMGMTNG